MTLIVGVRCQQAVVLAADGATTTTDAVAQSVARQQTHKLNTVHDEAILAVSGYDGLAQEMCLSLEEVLDSNDPPTSELEFRSKIRDALAGPIQKSVGLHRSLQGLPGVGGEFNPFLQVHGLLAVPWDDDLKLYVVEPECSLSEITAEKPCAAVGSGQSIADPFLGFLRGNLWEGVPNSSQGEVAAYWTIRHAIETNPGAIADPVHLTVLDFDDEDELQIRQRGDAEKQAHEDVIAHFEDRIGAGFELGVGGGIDDDEEEAVTESED